MPPCRPLHAPSPPLWWAELTNHCGCVDPWSMDGWFFMCPSSPPSTNCLSSSHRLHKPQGTEAYACTSPASRRRRSPASCGPCGFSVAARQGCSLYLEAKITFHVLVYMSLAPLNISSFIAYIISVGTSLVFQCYFNIFIQEFISVLPGREDRLAVHEINFWIGVGLLHSKSATPTEMSWRRRFRSENAGDHRNMLVSTLLSSCLSYLRSLISSPIDMVSASTSWRRERAHGTYPMRFCRTNNSSCESNDHGAVAILPSMNSKSITVKKRIFFIILYRALP